MQNQFRTVALLGLLSGLLIAISYWILGGSAGIITGIAIAAITNLKPAVLHKDPAYIKWHRTFPTHELSRIAIPSSKRIYNHCIEV